ncbi:NAD(P)/FAD-dependent oxidoreductase [Kitasatospora sp. NBC_00240]|uniref:flavin-containing monooxygenase n=1 Tax=Kitasatospora sp. NBC_00240 TaxID=2903567 RepID=UPI00224CE83F|nr:NAD(P)-binding domain-containing protein [Kitasatospora sp. NBC_00240]MCX5209063.1 NAD(P)/FAD-dependent oxidoreductase [Kitasatospora sp. NBC_00240]
MNEERFETVIIGGGQAGLSVGYHLAARGREFVILDGGRQVGDNWRAHWDSLRLYTPARYDGLPGMKFPGPRWSFPGKDAMGDFLAAYAERYRLPVRTGARVRQVRPDGDGYRVTVGDGELRAENVVVATGTFGREPYVPSFARELDAGIRQLHSASYRNDAQLRSGPVLVVGASHSGADIAYEASGRHRTVLCGRDTGQIPFRLGSRPMRAVAPLLWLLAGHVLTVRTPVGRKAAAEIRAHGGPLLRVRSADLAAAGVERVTDRMAGVRDGRPLLDGGRVLDVANVVWCTGFRQDFSWIDIPVFRADGWPEEDCGIVAASPGLYFAGLSFQRAFSSMLVGGAGRDARIVAKHIAAREPSAAGRAGSARPRAGAVRVA